MTGADRRSPAYVCPVCHADVRREPEAYVCAPCVREYPIVAEIPDFRLQPDPWLGIEEDREKALRVAAAVAELPFLDAVRRYWDMTPDTPRERADHFVAHVERSLERSRQWIARWREAATNAPWLDLGAGTGDLSAAATSHGLRMVAIDIALRWLVIARRRPGMEETPLVCCSAQQLPFADRSFAGAASLGLLEHCPAPDPVLREARRVLVPGARLRARTVNRYSVLREPHVGLWGVGFVPRRHADAWVRWRSGQRYLHHRPVSVRELMRSLRRTGFSDARVTAAVPLRSETASLGWAGNAMHTLYEVGRRTPGVRNALRWIAPLLEAEGIA